MTTTNTERDEAQLRKLIADLMSAICVKDVDRIMRFYADDAVVLDPKPPIQTRGAAAWRRTWEECLPHFPDSFQMETRDLNLHVSGDAAFAHWLYRFTGASPEF